MSGPPLGPGGPLPMRPPQPPGPPQAVPPQVSSVAGNPNRLPRAKRRQTPDPELHGGVDVTEYLTIPDDPEAPQLIPTADGGLIYVDENAERESPDDREFYTNLADGEILPDAILNTLSTDLLRKIKQDKEARKKRTEQYEMALRRTGLGKDAPGGAQFEGATKVVHPMITEACVDYCSRVMKEIYPIAGPVKPKIVGQPTESKAEKAQRICDHMNYQITTQIKEARSTLETLFTQVPLGGAGYILQFWDHRLKRARWEFVPIDHVYVPFTASDFYSAHRRTYSEVLPKVDFQQRVEQGMYRDLELAAPSSRPEPSKAETANQKIEGLDETGENLDGDREVYTCATYIEVTAEMAEALQIEEEGELYPYLVTIDEDTKQILSVYRDWEEDDEAREPIEHLFEFGFMPWRGALNIGLGQILDGLSGAATGALRALLDSAHANNSLTGFILKGSSISGQSKSPTIGQLIEIDSGIEAKSIRDVVMAPPFNPPSPVLFQLLGLVIEAGRGVVRTSLDETPTENNANVPVGTQLSRVEEGLVVFSAIHGRAHAALNRLLAGLYRLNRLYLPEEVSVDGAGQEIFVKRSDYEGPCDIQPVSDPTIYSDQQRFAQIAALEQSAAMFPNLYNIRAIEKRKMALWKIPDPDEILMPEQEPQEMNAVNENLHMAMGKPAKAFPQQDHIAHLSVLLDFMQNPILGSNPLLAQIYLPLACRHAAEHLALYYVSTITKLVTDAAQGAPQEFGSNEPVLKATYDRLLAEASQNAMGDISGQLQGAIPVIQQALAILQAASPKPPMDPVQGAIHTAMAETQRKAAADQSGSQLDGAKLQQEAQNNQQRNIIDLQRVQAMRDNATIQAQTKIQTTQMDNETAADAARMRIESGGGSHFSNGESLTG